jgi:hypothetical protein
LAKDDRDLNGDRLECAIKELKAFWSQKYASFYDLSVVSEDNQIPDVARLIYASYLKSF